LLSDLNRSVLFIVLEMRFQCVLNGGSVDSMENVPIFRGVEDMDDMGLGEFVFHGEEEFECDLTVKGMIVSEHGLFEPTGHVIESNEV